MSEKSYKVYLFHECRRFAIHTVGDQVDEALFYNDREAEGLFHGLRCAPASILARLIDIEDANYWGLLRLKDGRCYVHPVGDIEDALSCYEDLREEGLTRDGPLRVIAKWDVGYLGVSRRTNE